MDWNDWIGLDLIDWIGLDGLDWIGLDWMDWIASIGLRNAELGSTHRVHQRYVWSEHDHRPMLRVLIATTATTTVVSDLHNDVSVDHRDCSDWSDRVGWHRIHSKTMATRPRISRGL